MPVVVDDRSVESTLVFDSDYSQLGDSEDTALAGTRDGRFIFLLEQVGDEDRCSFDIGILDIYFAKRLEIRMLDDFNFPTFLCGFYALDETTLVIITYQEEAGAGVVRQWLVRIDKVAKTARCDVYRNYAMTFTADNEPKTSIGEECALVATSEELFVLPLNPLSPLPHTDFSQMLRQATARLPAQTNHRLHGTPLLANPFIITSSAIGFFIECDDVSPPANGLMEVAVLDLTNGASYLQEVSSSAPLSTGLRHFFMGTIVKPINDREVIVAGCWDDVVNLLVVLDTRRLQYTEITGIGRISKGASLIPFADSVVFAEEVETEVEEECVLTGHSYTEKTYSQKYTLIRHPFRVPQLVRLAAIATKKSDAASSEELAMLAARVG